MAKEIEVKYLLERADVPELLKLDLIRTFARGEPVQKRLISVYYDTPELSLKARKLGFRLRDTGESWIQTVKGEVSAVEGLYRREELETPLSGPHPDFEVLKNSIFKSIFSNHELCVRMKPVFTTDFLRTLWLLDLEAGTTVELVLDEGRVFSGERECPILEIELELKKGSEAVLMETSRYLARQLRLRPGLRSKAARGYALLS